MRRSSRVCDRYAVRGARFCFLVPCRACGPPRLLFVAFPVGPAALPAFVSSFPVGPTALPASCFPVPCRACGPPRLFVCCVPCRACGPPRLFVCCVPCRAYGPPRLLINTTKMQARSPWKSGTRVACKAKHLLPCIRARSVVKLPAVTHWQRARARWREGKAASWVKWVSFIP